MAERVPPELIDAARANAARERVAEVAGELAARPLDEDVAGQMRAALEQISSPAVRRAVRNLTARPTRPHLTLVPTGPAQASPVARTALGPTDVEGGVA